MATQEQLQVYGTQLLFRDVTDFPNSGAGPPNTAANSLIIGTPTEVQIDLTDVAAAAARQSDKTATLAQMGVAWPREWVFGACLEHVATPTAGETVEFYWNASPNEAAATGNSGGASGSDAAYAVAGKEQLIYIGAMILRANVINIDSAIGTIWLPYLYGSLIVINTSPTKAFHSAMDETHIVATPIIQDLQAAA